MARIGGEPHEPMSFHADICADCLDWSQTMDRVIALTPSSAPLPASLAGGPGPPAARRAPLWAWAQTAAMLLVLIGSAWLLVSHWYKSSNKKEVTGETVLMQGGVLIEDATVRVSTDTVQAMSGARAVVVAGPPPGDEELDRLLPSLNQMNAKEIAMLRDTKRWITTGRLAVIVLAGTVLLNGVQVDAQNDDKADPDKPKVEKKADVYGELIQQLGAKTFKTREAATQKLVKAGKDAIPALKKALKSDDVEIRSRAKAILAKLEPKPKPDPATKRPATANRGFALRMGGGLRRVPAPKKATKPAATAKEIDALIAKLGDAKTVAAARAKLSKLGRLPMGQLVNALGGENATVKAEAMKLLEAIGKAAVTLEKKVGALIKQLDDPKAATRAKAALALVKLGKDAVPQLQKAAAATKSVEVKARIKSIVSRITPKKASTGARIIRER